MRFRLAAALLVLAGAAGCASQATAATAPPATVAPHLEKPDLADHLLFAARARTGTIRAQDDTHATLVLTDAPTVTWFADRPHHDGGVTSTPDALETFGWKANGDSLGDPPNAVVVANEYGDDSPVFDILTASVTGNDLSLDIQFEKPQSVEGPLHNIELFIDDGGGVPWIGTVVYDFPNYGGGIIQPIAPAPNPAYIGIPGLPNTDPQPPVMALFNNSDVVGGVTLRTGQRVQFVLNGDSATSVQPVAS